MKRFTTFILSLVKRMQLAIAYAGFIAAIEEMI